MYALKQDNNILKNMKSLKELRVHFKKFIDGLEIEKLDFKKQERLEKLQDKATKIRFKFYS